MDEVLELLGSSDANESALVSRLRNQARQLIVSIQSDPSSTTPNIHDILTQVFKPLFSKSRHPDITSTGRKILVSQPDLPDRFGHDSIFEPPPPWKNSWTVPLLSWILSQYTAPPDDIDRQKKKKTAIESHFHLLVPPLLFLIDDVDIIYKAAGCRCLNSLCATLTTTQSDIMKRTGLAEVFFEALKNCFHYLPSLTPEGKSMYLLRALYPAYLKLVHACFVAVETYIQIIPSPPPVVTTPITSTEEEKPITKQSLMTLSATQVSAEIQLRGRFLSTLLRQSLLHGISHLSVGTGGGTTTSTKLTTFFLSQLPQIMVDLRIDAHAHLQVLVPMLVNTLRDPFVPGTAPDVLSAAVQAMDQGVLRVCWIRVRERWWMECLRGLVGAWMGCADEIASDGKHDESKKKNVLTKVMDQIGDAVALLAEVMTVATGDNDYNNNNKGDNNEMAFHNCVELLVNEEPELKSLFHPAEPDT